MNSTAPLPLVPIGFMEEDESHKIIVVVIIFAIFEVIFTGLFWAARSRMGTLKGLDTYLMIPGFIFSFGNLMIGLISVQYAGLGRHWVYVIQQPHMVPRFLKMQLALVLVSPIAKTLPKVSILCLYLRVFSIKSYRYATFVIGAIIIATCIASYCVGFAVCTPLAYQWDKSIPGGRCIDEFKFFTWIGMPNIITDLVMILLPLPIIWRLQTTIAQKIGLTITFFAGSVGIFTSTIRFAVLIRIEDPYADPSWTCTDMVMWTMIEPGMYLIAACLPSLRPILLPWFNTLDFNAAQDRARYFFGMRSRDSDRIDPEDVRLSGFRRPPRAKRRAGERGQRLGDGDSSSKLSDDRVWKGTFGDAGAATCYRQSLSEDSERIGPIRELNVLNHAIVVEKAYTITTESRVM